jgi:hydroxymethylpyrimidine pyrophosphatase-like HAD family hydrolase
MNDKKNIRSAWLFDVDGVLSNVQTRTITQMELVAILIDKLQKGDPVALITGRGLTALQTMVIQPLKNFVKENEIDEHILHLLFVSGEFGGVRLLHTNGNPVVSVDHNISLPEDLKKQLIAATKEYEDVIYFETKKQTMLSLPSYPHTADTTFVEKKDEIIAALRKITAKHPEIEVHSDRYAINIKNKKANKHYSTSQFLNWLEEKKLSPDHYFAFGDSISDLEIGQELYDRNLPAEFIFVGREHELEGIHIPFSYSITSADFDEGTVEYLTQKG